jgi:hypothetical protein
MNYKLTAKYIVKKALSRLTKVEVKIHRVCITANKFSRNGNAELSFSPSQPNPLWSKKKFRKATFLTGPNGEKASIHHDKIDEFGDYSRNVRVETSDSNPEFLACLDEILSVPKVTLAEYAIDFKCCSPEAARDMFYLLRRYLFFPEKYHLIKIYGGEFYGWGDTPAENRVYTVQNKAKNTAVNMYERGPDKAKQWANGHPFWSSEDIDRVRLEFRFTNNENDYHLRKNGIVKLSRFIGDPHFTEMIIGKFAFCENKPDCEYPQEDENFSIEDDSGCTECFQAMFRHIKSEEKYPYGFKVEAKRMKPFMDMFETAVKKAARKWSKKAKKLGYSGLYPRRQTTTYEDLDKYLEDL